MYHVWSKFIVSATVYDFETERASWSMNSAYPLTGYNKQLASNLVIFTDTNSVDKPITSTHFSAKDHLILC